MQVWLFFSAKMKTNVHLAVATCLSQEVISLPKPATEVINDWPAMVTKQPPEVSEQPMLANAKTTHLS